jgi:hypothetical protein
LESVNINEINANGVSATGYKYGARLGFALFPSNNFTIIPNIGYEVITFKGTWNGYANTENENQFSVGLKALDIPIDNVWIKGEAYYLHGIGNKVSYNNGGGSYAFDNGSGYLFGAKIGYELYKRQNLILSPFIGISYSSISDSYRGDSFRAGTTYLDAGFKVSF